MVHGVGPGPTGLDPFLIFQNFLRNVPDMAPEPIMMHDGGHRQTLRALAYILCRDSERDMIWQMGTLMSEFKLGRDLPTTTDHQSPVVRHWQIVTCICTVHQRTTGCQMRRRKRREPFWKE